MDFLADFIVNYALQVLLTVGAIFAFGRLITIVNSFFYKQAGALGKAACYATGFIGTPIHELSHAFMCLVFGHKITDIKLFQIESADGTLGYVSHTYNPRNLYQRIGNLFIGVAPIIAGSALLSLLMWLLLPSFYQDLNQTVAGISTNVGFINSCTALFKTAFGIFTYIGTWQFWVFILPAGMIALHMTLSKADLEGALSGVIFYLGLFLLTDIVLVLINQNLIVDFTELTMSFTILLVVCFLIFLIVVGLMILVMSILKPIIRLVKK